MMMLLGLAIDLFVFAKYTGLVLMLIGLYWLFKK